MRPAAPNKAGLAPKGNRGPGAVPPKFFPTAPLGPSKKLQVDSPEQPETRTPLVGDSSRVPTSPEAVDIDDNVIMDATSRGRGRGGIQPHTRTDLMLT
jgi:hypothetical protein